MKLREDIRKKQGAAFNLQDFHNSLMKQGFAPIKVIRKAMRNEPTIDWLLENQGKVEHFFHQQGIEGKL